MKDLSCILFLISVGMVCGAIELIAETEELRSFSADGIGIALAWDDEATKWKICGVSLSEQSLQLQLLELSSDSQTLTDLTGSLTQQSGLFSRTVVKSFLLECVYTGFIQPNNFWDSDSGYEIVGFSNPLSYDVVFYNFESTPLFVTPDLIHLGTNNKSLSSGATYGPIFSAVSLNATTILYAVTTAAGLEIGKIDGNGNLYDVESLPITSIDWISTDAYAENIWAICIGYDPVQNEFPECILSHSPATSRFQIQTFAQKPVVSFIDCNQFVLTSYGVSNASEYEIGIYDFDDATQRDALRSGYFGEIYLLESRFSNGVMATAYYGAVAGLRYRFYEYTSHFGCDAPVTANGPTSLAVPSSPTATPIATPVTAPQGVPLEVQLGVGLSLGVGGGVGLVLLIVFMVKRQNAQKKEQVKEDIQLIEEPVSPPDNSPGYWTTPPEPENMAKSVPSEPNHAKPDVKNDATDHNKYTGLEPQPALALGVQTSDAVALPDIEKRMQIPYTSLTFIREIGSGSYGKVFLGEWNGSKVAIKVNNQVTDVQGFLAEAKLTLQIAPHPNLVQTFGVSLDGPNPCIVLEYCNGGSLDSLLFAKNAKPLSVNEQRNFAVKVAYGLWHLHRSAIVHRDLAARNVLLTNDNQPKISDFGMSRMLKEEQAKGRTQNNYGPIRWMAPESLRDRSYSTKSDVWSYGLMVAGQEPHATADHLVIAVQIRDNALTPVIPAQCDPVLRRVMEMCWQRNPSDRPSMEQIIAVLKGEN